MKDALFRQISHPSIHPRSHPTTHPQRRITIKWQYSQACILCQQFVGNLPTLTSTRQDDDGKDKDTASDAGDDDHRAL